MSSARRGFGPALRLHHPAYAPGFNPVEGFWRACRAAHRYEPRTRRWIPRSSRAHPRPRTAVDGGHSTSVTAQMAGERAGGDHPVDDTLTVMNDLRSSRPPSGHWKVIRGSSQLDDRIIWENYLLVNDRRVPGDPRRKMTLYKCPRAKCGRTQMSEIVPECPVHHALMIPARSQKPKR